MQVSFYNIIIIHVSCLFSVLVWKALLIFSDLEKLLIPETANTPTPAGFLFYRIIWTGLEIITVIDPAAHLLYLFVIMEAYYNAWLLPWWSPSTSTIPSPNSRDLFRRSK